MISLAKLVHELRGLKPIRISEASDQETKSSDPESTGGIQLPPIP